MNLTKLNSLLLACCFPLFLGAQEAGFQPISDISSVTRSLVKHASATNTLQSNFVQEKHLNMLEEVLTSHGQFFFKKENNVRWQYLDPIKYTILIHQGKFTIDNDGKVSEFNTDGNPMFREINKMIITAIRGDFVGNTEFAPVYFEGKAQVMARLVPVVAQVKSMIESIDIYFDKVTMQVVKVVFIEPGGDFTLIRFEDIQVNKEIPDSRFELTNGK